MIFDQTIIQSYATAKISGALAELKSVSKVRHPLLTGELRESFLYNLLTHFIPDRYGIASGVIVNHAGYESHQWDLIIYDKTIMSPFILEMSRGIFSAEHVLAVIEVKSRFTKTVLEEINDKAYFLGSKIYNETYFFRKENAPSLPIISAIGLYGTGVKEMRGEKGTDWVTKNLYMLSSICLCENYCYLRVGNEWRYSSASETHEEIKRFIFTLLDNVRTRALNNEYCHLHGKHADWYGIYARDQEGIRDYFRNPNFTTTSESTTTLEDFNCPCD